MGRSTGKISKCRILTFINCQIACRCHSSMRLPTFPRLPLSFYLSDSYPRMHTNRRPVQRNLSSNYLSTASYLTATMSSPWNYCRHASMTGDQFQADWFLHGFQKSSLRRIPIQFKTFLASGRRPQRNGLAQRSERLVSLIYKTRR